MFVCFCCFFFLLWQFVGSSYSLFISPLQHTETGSKDEHSKNNWQNTASFPVVLGDFGCDVTCQACRENSPGTASRYRARFQASSGHSDSANRPGYEAGQNINCYKSNKVLCMLSRFCVSNCIPCLSSLVRQK